MTMQVTSTDINDAFAAGAGLSWLDELLPAAILLFIVVFFLAGGFKTITDVVREYGRKSAGEIGKELIGIFIGLVFILVIFSMI